MSFFYYIVGHPTWVLTDKICPYCICHTLGLSPPRLGSLYDITRSHERRAAAPTKLSEQTAKINCEVGLRCIDKNKGAVECQFNGWHQNVADIVVILASLTSHQYGLAYSLLCVPLCVALAAGLSSIRLNAGRRTWPWIAEPRGMPEREQWK